MRHKYSKEILEPLVKSSISVAEVIRKLGIKQSGGNHSHISKLIKKFDLDKSHFLGSIANCATRHKPNKLQPNAVLVNNRLKGRREGTSRLRRVLLLSGIDHKCSVCGLLPFWNGKYLQLQIDHVNGIGTDNRLENLRFICGNCHMQTENFGIKNSSKYMTKKIIVNVKKPKKIKVLKNDLNWRNRPKLTTRKVVRPSKEDLEKLLWEKPTCQIAKQFGVSDNAIGKWVKSYGITKPGRGYWAKKLKMT